MCLLWYASDSCPCPMYTAYSAISFRRWSDIAWNTVGRSFLGLNLDEKLFPSYRHIRWPHHRDLLHAASVRCWKDEHVLVMALKSSWLLVGRYHEPGLPIVFIKCGELYSVISSHISESPTTLRFIVPSNNSSRLLICYQTNLRP